MSTALSKAPAPAPARPSRLRSTALVFGCTVCGAAAQLLIKMGMSRLTDVPGHALFTTLTGLTSVVSNVPLMTGMSLYGISTILLVLALRGAELSLMYPVISLTYVWVTGLSVLVFHESVNPYKVIGVAVIVLGVAVLGLDGGKS